MALVLMIFTSTRKSLIVMFHAKIFYHCLRLPAGVIKTIILDYCAEAKLTVG